MGRRKRSLIKKAVLWAAVGTVLATTTLISTPEAKAAPAKAQSPTTPPAKTEAPITAVWGPPGQTQINVCRACLEEKMRLGEWEVEGARLLPHA